MKTWDSEFANIETASNVEIPPFKTAGPIDLRVDTIRSSALPPLIIYEINCQKYYYNYFSGKLMLLVFLEKVMFFHITLWLQKTTYLWCIKACAT